MRRSSIAERPAWVVGAILAVIACSLAVAGCGAEHPSKAAFVRHMTSISSTDADSPEWQVIWGCVYDTAVDDDTVDQMMAIKPGVRPGKELSRRVSDAVVRCIPEQGLATTTVPGTSTGATTGTSSPR